MARLIGGSETRSVRDLGTLRMFRVETDLRVALAGGPDATAARSRLVRNGVDWWPLSDSFVQWLAERDAERARKRNDDDLVFGMVVDYCPAPASACELCNGREGLSRGVAEWHHDGTIQGPFCFTTCSACVEAERGPYFDDLDWFGADGYRRRLAEHAGHLGWDDPADDPDDDPSDPDAACEAASRTDRRVRPDQRWDGRGGRRFRWSGPWDHLDDDAERGRHVPENVPGRIEFVHRSWPADPAQLSVIRHELAGWLAPLALTDDETAGVVLAVDEAAANAVRHAYGPGRSGVVELTLWTEAGTLCVEVVDHGNWVPPIEPPAVDGLADRGRGIPLMGSMAEAVLIHHDSRGSRVLLRHPVPADRDTVAGDDRNVVAAGTTEP